jgi:hypothetical protein
MMRALAVVLSALMLCSFQRPPPEYRGCVVNITTIYASPDVVEGFCSWFGLEGALGCADDRFAVLIHPSHWRNAWGDYAEYVEHELGHACGWPADHPR